MSGRILCPLGHAHWPQQAWIHEKCVRAEVVVGRPPSVTDAGDATNTANLGAGATNAVTNGRTLNRRDRADYNAYQRELMRKRRAAARAGFEGGAE